MGLTIAIAVVCFAVGAGLSYLFFRYGLKTKYENIIKEAETEAEVIKKNKLLEVKEKFLNKKADLEKEVALRNQKIQQVENKLKQREMVLNQKQDEVQRKRNEAEAIKANLEAQIAIVDKKKEEWDQKKEELDQKKEELNKVHQQELEKLEALSGLSAEEAKERLIESLKEEAKTEAASYINDIMDDAKMTANKEAKRIVIQSIQRVATETAIENSVTVFHIDSDEIKGRIIGREGRNIRALEAATGVEIVVDDTPEAIVLSAFDPVRREIARLALHQLVTDGRIHPARIEEVVAKVKKQVEEEIIETGKRTTIDLGIHGLHPELIRIIGKMKYRSSYGQNLLQHARETANLCAVMASELGLNPKKAKRAGLLHDIGKVPDEENELPHALYGMKLAEKFKEKPDICNAIGAHHDEVEMTSLLAPIVQVCDAISGARPGARREIVEAYIKRLNDLENLAMSYPGVTKTYAIQAGRELRVIVGADKIDDKQTECLSAEIAKKIQDEMTYPGQVKITVIRETRAVSFAKYYKKRVVIHNPLSFFSISDSLQTLHHLLSTSISLFIELIQFLHIGFHTSYHNRFFGTDNNDSSFILQTFHQLKLLVVELVSVTKGNPQTGIFLVYELRNEHLLGGLPIAPVTSQDHYTFVASLFEGTKQRYGIDNASVEHRTTLDINHRTRIRKTAGRLHDINNPLGIFLLFPITRPTGEAIGRYHFETGRILCIRLVVVWQDTIGKAMKKQLLVKKSPSLQQGTDTYILILGQQLDVAILASAPLMRHIRQAVACTGRHTNHIREPDLVVHQIIQHPVGENASHSPTFKHQSCIIADFEHSLYPYF